VTTKLPAVEVAAYAKINLSLDVLGTRADGFHELRSVMQTVSLHDTVTIHAGNAEAEPAAGASGDFSLIDRAIEAVREVTGAEQGICYGLTKRIPSAAGLGGGSSDCAAAIRAACMLLNLSPSPQTLHELAARLGSDVPFFLVGGAALVEGRGERVRPLRDIPETWFLLGGQGTTVSTRTVFDMYDSSHSDDGRATDRVLDGLRRGTVTFGGNDLTMAALRGFPEIQSTFDTLAAVAPPKRISMTGSGGTVVALFEDSSSAKAAYDGLKGCLPWLSLASSVARGQSVKTR